MRGVGVQIPPPTLQHSRCAKASGTCHPDFGVNLFNYANGDVLLVQVGGACNTVSNGHRAAFIEGSSLRIQIKGLLAFN